MTKKKLVIIGGGFAGITLAKQVLKSPSLRKKFDLVLVDKNDYQLFFPALFNVVSAQQELSKIFSSVAIKFKDIFPARGGQARNNIEILKEEVINIEPGKNKIIFKSRHRGRLSLKYDYLIATAGSEPKVGGLTFNSFEDALAVKEKLTALFKTKAKKEEININVVGAGLTGCELSAVLLQSAHKLAVKFGHPRKLIKVKLIEAKKNILFSTSPWFRKKVSSFLKEIGVEILLNKKGENTESDLTIQTVGVEPIHFADFENHKNVLVIETKTAYEAIHKAKYAKAVLEAGINKNKKPCYRLTKKFYIIEFGKNKAFADLGILKLRGRLAFWLHQLAFLRYLISILSPKKAINWMMKYRKLTVDKK